MLRPLRIAIFIIATLLPLASASAIAERLSEGRYDWPVLGAIDGDTLKLA